MEIEVNKDRSCWVKSWHCFWIRSTTAWTLLFHSRPPNPGSKMIVLRLFCVFFWIGPWALGSKMKFPTYICSMLGPCWVIWWALWGSMEVSGGENQSQRASLSVEVHFGWLFGTMLSQCWAVLGLCWAYVGSFGGPEKFPTKKNFWLEIFWGF